MRTQCRTLTIVLFLLLSSEVCFGQTSFKGLTPGRSTKKDVERVLGQPIRVVQATLVEYKSGKGTKIFVQYGENGSVVERIEAVYPDKVERTTLIRSLNLPAMPTASQTNQRGRLEEYFAMANIVLTYAEADAGSGVSSVGYYSRELFASAVAGVPRDPQVQGQSAAADQSGRGSPREPEAAAPVSTNDPATEGRWGYFGTRRSLSALEAAQALGLSADRGVLIRYVYPDSPAARAGIKVGDIITAYNGEPLIDADQYNSKMRQTRPGMTIRLKVLADRNEREVSVQLVEIPLGVWRSTVFFSEGRGGNVAEAIRIAKEALAENPEDLEYLIPLSDLIDKRELSASPPDLSHMTDAADFVRRAIQLVEAGKSPPPSLIDVVDWQRTKAVELAALYGRLARIEELSKNNDQALAYYARASALDPAQPDNFHACGWIHHNKYLEADQKLRALQSVNIQNAEVRAIVDEINKDVDGVIDCYSRFVGLTATLDHEKGRRDAAEAVLSGFHKYRDEFRNYVAQLYKNQTSTVKKPSKLEQLGKFLGEMIREARRQPNQPEQ